MKAAIGIIASITVIGAIVLTVIDLASTPTPPKSGTCLLVTRIFLPDICLGSCADGRTVDCPVATTRPYAIFFTQAASCGLGVICLP